MAGQPDQRCGLVGQRLMLVGEVRKMKLDKSLITGIVLGIVAGLFFTAQLVAFTQILVIVSVVLLMRYLHIV